MMPEEVDHLRLQVERIERIAVVTEQRRIVAAIDKKIDLLNETARKMDQSGGDSGLWQEIIKALNDVRAICFRV
jgi:uncharacterized coiled-coil protein SlyX